MLDESSRHWSIAEAAETYNITSWGRGYFSINSEGNVCVHPDKDPQRGIDLPQLVETLQLRQLELPLLLRFNGILKDRIDELHSTFQAAIAEHKYQGSYLGVYPIKVNQQRQVVEQIVQHGRKYSFGLEAGSKPELLAVIAMTDIDTPIICNGFKDDE